jgi:hypothetical protein
MSKSWSQSELCCTVCNTDYIHYDDDADICLGVLKELKRMSPNHQITMLKFIKNLSMLSTTLDALQNSNAIDVLTDLLRNSSKEPHSREVSNQVLNTIYNLCRLNKSRQEDAALNGIIPVLQRIIKTKGPLKEFALPVLCDMAHSGKVGRRELWRNKGLAFYISLLADEYWQVTALDAIFIWYVSIQVLKIAVLYTHVTQVAGRDGQSGRTSS